MSVKYGFLGTVLCAGGAAGGGRIIICWSCGFEGEGIIVILGVLVLSYRFLVSCLFYRF